MKSKSLKTKLLDSSHYFLLIVNAIASGCFSRELLHVIDYQYQIATATCSWHLPSMHFRQHRILVDEALHTTLNHGWEHGYLGIKRSLEGRSKRREILARMAFQQSSAALARCLHLCLGDVLAFHHRTTWAARLHRNHADMALQPSEHLLIAASFKLLRPETVVVIMTAPVPACRYRWNPAHRSRCHRYAQDRFRNRTPAWQESPDSYQATSPARSSLIILRVEVERPQRSRTSKVGTSDMVIAHPGAWQLTYGWSIQVPAKSRRVGS